MINKLKAAERFLNFGVGTVGSSMEEYLAVIRADMAMVDKVIQDVSACFEWRRAQ